MKSLVVIAVICSLFYSSVDGLKCYECAYAEARTANNGTVRAPLVNSKCFSDWDQVPLNECSPLEKYCQIIIAEGGGARTITRSCIVKPLFDDGTTDVAGVKTSYSSCQEDACNAATSLSSGIPAAVLLVLAAYGLAF